jgi:hypothetical protein
MMKAVSRNRGNLKLFLAHSSLGTQSLDVQSETRDARKNVGSRVAGFGGYG